jgi:hypothetical protein
MLKRLLKRAETSGRADDNIESIKKRFGEVPADYLELVVVLISLSRTSHLQGDDDAGHRPL